MGKDAVQSQGEPVFDAHHLTNVFTLLFTPSAFLIAGISSWAIGWGLDDKRLATSLFWRVGLAAAATFLAVNLTMEAAG